MKKVLLRLPKLALLAVLLTSSTWAATIANMQFVSDAAGSGVFIFNIDGELRQVFCDQYEPNAQTGPYQAHVSTLADLTNTVLGLQGDPLALFKYQRVAILNLQALLSPTLAVDVVRAARRTVDGHGPLTPTAQGLYDFALAANANDYDLTGFRIYTNLRTQEVTGFDGGFNLNLETPEPSALVLFGSGVIVLAAFRRRSR